MRLLGFGKTDEGADLAFPGRDPPTGRLDRIGWCEATIIDGLQNGAQLKARGIEGVIGHDGPFTAFEDAVSGSRPGH